jgi:type VI secretion system protein ImpC
MPTPNNKSESSPEKETAVGEPSLVDQAAEATYIEKSSELSEDVQELGRVLVRHYRDRIAGTRIDTAFINGALKEIDQCVGEQLDTILHNEDFQKLESSWTGLKWLVDRTDFNENIIIEVLNAPKDELLNDFTYPTGDITTTGYYQKLYTSQYGMPNGKPYACTVLNYYLSHNAPDMTLLGKVSEVANMAHAPVISSIAPEFFGKKGFEHLTDASYKVKEALEGNEYVRWHGFREEENSRYVGLTMPRFLLRIPYNASDNPVDSKEFNYAENLEGEHQNYLWGNAAFAFASRLTESFKRYRWCWRIVGEESGGAITDLNMHIYDEHGETVQKPPTEFGLSFRKEQELNEAGFMPILWQQGKNQAVIYRAPSAKLPLQYPDTPEGNKNQRDDQLRLRLPYVFILTRFAHYLKRLQTRYIGEAVDKATIKKELDDWILQYVNHVKKPVRGTLGPTPLYEASVEVEEDAKIPGVYLCHVSLTPHTLVEGFTTTLSLVTRQDTAGE